MKIHFVSYGHVFRSRLAEAYLRFLLRKQLGYQVSSSGIKYDKSVHGPIAWYAMKILSDHQLTGFMADVPVVTTKDLLDSQDLVIFLDDFSKEYCERHFGFRIGFHNRTAEVWNMEYIPVTPEEHAPGKVNTEKDAYLIYLSEHIFKEIQKCCSRLADELNFADVPFKE